MLFTIYNSRILPHLQYAVLKWGFKMGNDELLQKYAVRVITSCKYDAHTEQLNFLKVKDIFELTALKLFYKLKYNCLPVHITGMFQDFSREHDHNTRQHLVLNIVFSSSCYCETRQHSTQSVRNMPPASPRHLLPHVLQIMPRNANYDHEISTNGSP